jgi:hypothetical protein
MRIKEWCASLVLFVIPARDTAARKAGCHPPYGGRKLWSAKRQLRDGMVRKAVNKNKVARFRLAQE